MKVERVSYDVITPSAARGILAGKVGKADEIRERCYLFADWTLVLLIAIANQCFAVPFSIFSRLRKIKAIMTASLDKDLGEIISRLPKIFLRHLSKAAVPLVMTI